jgi:hypothetical protein
VIQKKDSIGSFHQGLLNFNKNNWLSFLLDYFNRNRFFKIGYTNTLFTPVLLVK